MLIKYTCKDMGLHCTFSIKGENIDDVARQALEHVREQHANDFNLIQTPEQIERMKQALINSMREVVH